MFNKIREIHKTISEKYFSVGGELSPSKSSAMLCIHQWEIDVGVQDLNTAMRLYHPTISSNCHINPCKKQCTLHHPLEYTSFVEHSFLIYLNGHFKVHQPTGKTPRYFKGS